MEQCYLAIHLAIHLSSRRYAVIAVRNVLQEFMIIRCLMAPFILGILNERTPRVDYFYAN